jgi:hypothetical protein
MLQSALAVDPEGAVELMRWTLRSDRAADLFEESSEVRFDSRNSFLAWFDEFRRKAAVE